MSHFQVVATMDNGAQVMFGVDGDDEAEAMLAAHERLSRFIQDVGMIRVAQLGGNRGT